MYPFDRSGGGLLLMTANLAGADLCPRTLLSGATGGKTEASAHFAHSAPEDDTAGEIAGEIAGESGVDPATVRRDAE